MNKLLSDTEGCNEMGKMYFYWINATCLCDFSQPFLVSEEEVRQEVELIQVCN